MPRSKVNLIQRARCVDRNGKDLDSAFHWDNMGSAEFEFGTLPRSIRQMRLWDNEVGLVCEKLGHFPYEPLWYVGLPGARELATEIVNEEIELKGHVNRKERSRLYVALCPGQHAWERTDIDTWIAVSDRLPKDVDSALDIGHDLFALFLDSASAETFLRLLRAKSV